MDSGTSQYIEGQKEDDKNFDVFFIHSKTYLYCMMKAKQRPEFIIQVIFNQVKSTVRYTSNHALFIFNPTELRVRPRPHVSGYF